MKAKLKNNSVEIERLSKLLEEAKARQSSRAETAQNNVVVISQLDERGRPMQLPKVYLCSNLTDRKCQALPVTSMRSFT